jgi:quercetin dioxygenase-like cupin family protein
MRSLVIAIVTLGCITGCMAAFAAAPQESVTPLLSQPIVNIPGRTFSSAVVEFPPGAKADPHRHGDAFVYAYVLSGSVRSQLDDQPAKIYRTGEDWTEQPGARHKLTENVSKTAPARLLVVFVAPTGAALKTPE